MRLCILVIASLSSVYQNFYEAWNQIQFPEWVTVRFVFLVPNLPQLLIEDRNVILVSGRECIKPGIWYKTREAMAHLLQTQEFDYLLRSNLSSFFNVDALAKFLEDKPRTNAMFGHYVFNSFLSGSGYVMTRDVVERFLEWDTEEDININTAEDDLVTSYFMNKNNIPHEHWTMANASEELSVTNIQTRCYSNGSGELADREKDVENFKSLVLEYNLIQQRKRS